MKKLYLLLTFFFFALSNLTAQTTVEDFEGATNGQSSFTSSAKTFNISSNLSTFKVFDTPGTPGFGYNQSSNFIQVGDQAGGPPGTYGQKGTISTTGGYKLNSLWIYVTGDPAAQNPNVTYNNAPNGSVTFTGKLAGSTQFTVTKTYPNTNIGFVGAANGFNFVDFAAQSGLNIDTLEIQLSNEYDYFAIDNFTWTANTTPTIATTGTLTTLASCAGSVSASQNFSVTGTNLTTGISVAGPTGYEFSATSGGTYATTLLLPAAGGTVYVRLSSSATGNPGGNITLASTGASPQTVAVSGIVTPIPNVTSNPSVSTICAAGSTSFTVVASNTTGYQWQVNTGSGFTNITNGGVYSNATTATLNITGATAGMNGYTYRAIVSNGSCNDNSNSAALTVNPAPAITSQPSVSTICAGANTTFTVAASNATGYQWQENTGSGYTNITNGGVYSNATTATLNITGATAGMNGYTYRAVATGACTPNATSNGVALTVNSAPAITSQPSVSTICAAGSTTFTVAASNATGYQWQQNTGSGYTNITNGGVYSNATTATLMITGATAGMNGYTYRAVASGACTPSATSNGVALTVNSAPFISGHPAASSICPGTNTTFSVTAVNVTGYQWQENTGSGFANITNGGVYSNATTSTLTITAATAGMNGYTYRVVVTGGCTPAATSNSAALTMSGSPAVTGNPPNRTICTGFNTTFPVTATGATGYQWQVSTDGGGNYNDIANGAPYSGVTTATLTVTGATSAITGYRYRCTVSSSCGSTNSNGGTLSVITIVIGQSQTNVTTYGGANGTATATPSGGISPYIYSWSPSGGTGATASGLTAGTYTVTVTDNITCQATSANYVITQPAGVGTSVSTLSAFATCSGTASASKNFTVNGGGLTADLVVTAPTGYEVSLTSGSGYGSSVSLTQTGGNVATTTIYVRMATSASGTMAGNVTVTSTGVTTKNVAVTGLASNLSASSYIVSNVSCFGGTNGSIDLTPSGGQSPYTYNWGSASTQDRINLPAGTYSVTITDGNGCIYTVSNIVIGQPVAALSAATGGGKTDVSCNGGTNGTATVAPTGGTPSYTYSWNTTPVQTTATATGLTAGTYTVTVTDANSCQTTRSFTINQPSVLSAATGSKTDVSCNGGANGTATVTPTGGTPSYTYSWDTTPVQTTATATGLIPGTYTVTVTDANSCQATRSFTINQPAAAISASAGTTNNTSCNGGSNGSATVNVTGGTTPYSYNWDGTHTGDGTATISGLAAGTYNVTVTDANGCQATQSFTITQPAVLVATAGAQTNVLCNGGTNGSATVSVTGGTGTYTYLWTPAGGTAATASGLAAGTYTVTVKDANLCQTTQSFTITQPAALVATAGAQSNVSCNGGATGSATVNVTGGTGTYTYLWTPSGGTAATASGLAAGTYTVTVKDANLCQTTQSFTITQPAAALATTAGTVNNTSCNGGANGSATVNVTGGTTPYTYDWTGTPTGDGTATISGLSAGTYTVTVTDANSCQATRTFTITQPSALVASGAAQTNVNCNGGTNGSATVSVTGGTGTYTYLWTPSGGTAATASGLAAGTYTVTVKDANLCQTTQSFTITQPLLLSATSSKTDVLCNGGASGTASVVVSGGTPGYTYVWSPSGGTAATATGLAVGNYSCLITDANGCQITRNFTINQPSVLAATTAQQNATCIAPGQASVTPSGGAGSYTYLWSPSGITTQLATGLSAGNHSCLITDANGCTLTKNFVITTTNTLVATTSQTDVLCNGANTGSATVVPAGAPGPYTYTWSPSGGSADTAANLAAGNYSVVIVSSNGCSITKNFTITQPSALIATAGAQTNLLCNGATNGSATVNVTGGTGAYAYLWTPSGGTAATASGLTAGTYTVTVKDANLCQTTQSFTITQPAALVATAGAQTNVSCNGGTNGTATVTVTGGTGAYSYLWTPSGGTAATASGLTAGTYTVTVKDANLCQTTQSFTITQPATLVATAGAQTNVLCNGGSTGSATVAVTGGTGTYTYLWAPTGGTAATASGLTAGTYTVTVKDANLCQTTQSFTITQPAALVATAGAQTNILCNGGTTGSATVAVTGGTGTYTYLWTPSGGTAATASGLTAGTYTVTVKDANLCQTTQSFTITQPAALVATAGAQTNILCNGGTTGSATVAVTGGTGTYTYLWAPTGGTAATASGLTAGTYTVTVKDANLCQTTQSFTITQPAALVATAGAQTNILCNGGSTGSATVAVTGGTGTYTYLWAPTGGTAATASGLTAGTYIVTVKDANLCQTTQSFTITQPAALVATAGAQTNVLCNGGSTGSATVAVTGGTGTYTYLWTPIGGTAATATGLTAGTYTVTVKDANLCQTTQSFTINQPTALVVTAGAQTNLLCNGGVNASATVNVTGGTGAYTYLWAPTGGTAATATGLAAGTYTVTVKDANLCQATQSFTITAPVAMTAATSQTNILCFGAATGSATVSNITGGTGTYTYAWAPSGGTAATATGLAAGIYTCTITDANGCTLVKTITITQPTILTVNGSSSNISCNGAANGSAGVTVTGGTGPYNYSWSPSGGNGSMATGLSGGTYLCTVTDANGCIKTHTFTILEQTPIVVTSVKTNVLCHGAATGSATVSATGGVPGYMYSWSTGSGSPTITGLTAGTYTCNVTDANGCSVVHTVIITSPDALDVDATQTNVSCSGNSDGSLGVEVTGGIAPYTYTWTPAVGMGATITGLTAGNYSVTITDANGCTTLRNFSLTQPAPLTASLTKTDVQCYGGNNGTAIAVVTGGTAPYTYAWTAPGGGTPDPANLIAGTYTVTITDANGCTFTGSITVNQPLQVVVTNNPQNATVNTGSNAIYTATAINATAYQWQYSADGTTWNNVVNGGSSPTYSGALTNILSITGIPASYNGYLYRVLAINASSCTIPSNSALLTVNNALIAVNDDFSSTEILAGTGGIAGDVTANDVFNSLPVDDNDVVISVVDNDGLFGVTIDSDGNLIVPTTAAVGTYTITYSICEVATPTNCSTAEAIVEVSDVTGIDDFRDIKLSIYPNPASTQVFIKIPDFSSHKNMKVTLYDLNGRLVKESHLTAELQSIEVSDVESGVYIFKITSDTGQASRRIIVEKKF
jgi:predicted secreted protein